MAEEATEHIDVHQEDNEESQACQLGLHCICVIVKGACWTKKLAKYAGNTQIIGIPSYSRIIVLVPATRSKEESLSQKW